MKMPKKVTNEGLARMMAKGFEDMATKNDLAEIKLELEEINQKFDHVVYKFEVKDLQKRVTVLERRVGVK